MIGVKADVHLHGERPEAAHRQLGENKSLVRRAEVTTT